MTIFLILILLTIIAISYYLMPNIKSKLILFISLIIVTTIGYNIKGSFESFTFNEENNKIIENIIISKEKIDELDPNRLIIYLENKLNKNPKDLQGWLILARTCNLSGYLQKADLYFKKGLEFFPYDETLLLEYSLLKKKTNQFKSALETLLKLKVIAPKNFFVRELIIDILMTIQNKNLAQKEWNEMMKSKNFDNNKLMEIRDKFEL